MLLSVETIRTKTFAHLHSYCRCVELIYQTFLKSGRQNCHCNNVFRPKKITATSFCSSLSEETHVKHDNYRKPQNAPGRKHNRSLSRWWHFCRLSTNGNFPFLQKREIHLFPKVSTNPSIVLVLHPLPCQVFCFALVSSSLAILSAHSTIE